MLKKLSVPQKQPVLRAQCIINNVHITSIPIKSSLIVR